MKKIILLSICFTLLLACQSKNSKSDTINSNSADSVQKVSEYQPDEGAMKQNVTGDYAFVEKSNNDYTYCEFSIQDLDQLSGEVTITLFENKKGDEYANPKASVSYPLQITRNDEGQLQVQPEIADIDDWNQSAKKFPALEKLFFADGSGFPMQNLVRKGKNFILAQTDADSIVLKRVTVK